MAAGLHGTRSVWSISSMLMDMSTAGIERLLLFVMLFQRCCADGIALARWCCKVAPYGCVGHSAALRTWEPCLCCFASCGYACV